MVATDLLVTCLKAIPFARKKPVVSKVLANAKFNACKNILAFNICYFLGSIVVDPVNVNIFRSEPDAFSPAVSVSQIILFPEPDLSP
jgi:hypothetical protein